MFVVSYCQIYSFHTPINLHKIPIFQSFQQTAEEIMIEVISNKSTFPFLIKLLLKDAASEVLAPEIHVSS